MSNIPKPKRSAEDILALGRLELKKKWPYFNTTLMGLIPHPTEDIETFAVTPGMVMPYNPTFVASIDPKMAASEMVHECSHVVRGDLEMFRNFPKEDWDLVNIGQDCAINPDIRAAGWELHPTWVFPEQFDMPPNLTAVEYINILLKKRHDKQSGKDKEKFEKACEKFGKRICFPPPGMQTTLDKDGRTDADKKRIVKGTLAEMKVYANNMAGRGSMPGYMKELIQKVEEQPRIPWRDRLEGLALNASGQLLSGGADYSLRYPSKRSYLRGLMRPGLVDQILNVVFIVDTSGSMNAKQMLIGMAEAFSIVEQMGIDRAWYIQADAAVAMEPQLLTLEELRGITEFKGRSGTDFRPAIAAAESLIPRADMIFYFTDGDGYAPPASPEGIIVIWCLIPQNARIIPHRPAAWGEVVLITEANISEDDLQSPYVPPAQQQQDDDEDE